MVAVCSIDSNVVKTRVVYDDDEHESTWLIIIIDTTLLATQSYIFVYTLDNNIEYRNLISISPLLSEADPTTNSCCNLLSINKISLVFTTINCNS